MYWKHLKVYLRIKPKIFEIKQFEECLPITAGIGQHPTAGSVIQVFGSIPSWNLEMIFKQLKLHAFMYIVHSIQFLHLLCTIILLSPHHQGEHCVQLNTYPLAHQEFLYSQCSFTICQAPTVIYFII